MVSAPKGLRLMVSLTVGTTEWSHLPQTVKKNVCHTSALLQGNGCGTGTRLLHCEYTEPCSRFTNRIIKMSEVYLFFFRTLDCIFYHTSSFSSNSYSSFRVLCYGYCSRALHLSLAVCMHLNGVTEKSRLSCDCKIIF